MAKNKSNNYTLTWIEKIEYGLLYSFVYLLSLLPLRALYLINDILIYPLIYRVVRYRVKLVRRHLQDCFPEKSQEERKRIEHKFYHYFGDLIMETIKGMSISEEEMMRRMDYHGAEPMIRTASTPQSIVVYLGHYCNWEWVTSVGKLIPDTSFVCQVYHVLENRVIDKLMLKIRSRMGTHNIPIADILRQTIEKNRKGQNMLCGYISDQVPFWNNIHYWTDFLHHDTPALTGAETIAKKFDQAVFYLDIQRVKRGYYRIDVIQMAEHSKGIPDFELTEQYFQLLERSIQRQPELWLWTHNRWKRTREEWEKRYKGKAYVEKKEKDE